MKVTNIRDGAVARIPTQQGDRTKIPTNSVGTSAIQDLSVTPAKLSNDANFAFWIKNGFQNFVETSYLTPITGSPGIGQFRTFGIQNRAQIPDLANDVSVNFGPNRIMCFQSYNIPTEFGPNGEKVLGVTNDTKNQIRLVGNWNDTSSTEGIHPLGNTAGSDYVEIVFYGTGLNLISLAATRDIRATIDGAAESATNILAGTFNSVLLGRNYGPNQVFNAATNLTLGLHTIKLRVVTGNFHLLGFEILNESTTLKINPGNSYVNGVKTILSAAQSPAYGSIFESGTLGTRGGRVLVYQKSDGSIAKAVTPTNATQQNLTSADHTNEDVARIANFREFGSSRNPSAPDDWSLGNMVTSNRAFTLDDGTTTLIGNLVDSDVVNGQDSFLAHASAGSFWSLTFVGTGLDVFVSSTTFGGQTFDVLVDGTAIASAATPYNVGWTKIVSGLPYGTHVVKIRQQGALAGGPRLSDFRIWEPKKPTLPAGAIELADYRLMADFVANSTAGTDNIATGVLRKTASREFIYIGSGWTANLGVTDLGGWEISTTTATDSFKITFFGTGFEWRFTNTVVTVATLQINIDGSTNLSASNGSFWSGALATSFYGGVTSFTPSTGTVVCSTTQQVGSGVRVSGLNLGFHTVTITRSTGTNNFHNTAFDIITPVYSPKPNSVSDIQNTLLIGSCAISDIRKFTPVKDPLQNQKAIAQAIGINVNPTVSSSIYVPLADMMCTVKVKDAGFLELKFSGTFSNSNAISSNGPSIKFYVDGVPIDPSMEPNSLGAGVAFTISESILVPVNAGTHTVAVYWQNFTSGTATAYQARRVLNVREI